MDIISSVTMRMVEYFGQDVKRINHAAKVHFFVRLISSGEKLEQNKSIILEIAAILHDIGIKNAELKYNSADGKYQEIEGPIVADHLMKDLMLSDEAKERIKYLIGNHHSYNKIDDIDFQILVEADFIVNVYEDNLKIENIKAIYIKYFKTKTGQKIFENLYLI